MPLRVAGAQLNLGVGDFAGNEERIVEAMAWAEREQADVLLLPELAVNGYPPEDLVLRADFVDAGRGVADARAALEGARVVTSIEAGENRPGRRANRAPASALARFSLSGQGPGPRARACVSLS